MACISFMKFFDLGEFRTGWWAGGQIIYILFPLLQTAHLLFHLLNSIPGLLFSTTHSINEPPIIAFIGDRHYPEI